MTKPYDFNRPRRAALGPADKPPPPIPPEAMRVPPPPPPKGAVPAPRDHALKSGPNAWTRQKPKAPTPQAVQRVLSQPLVSPKAPKIQRSKSGRHPITAIRLKPHVRAALVRLAEVMGTSVTDWVSQHVMRDYAALAAGGLMRS